MKNHEKSTQLDGLSKRFVLVDMLEPMHEPSEGFAPEIPWAFTHEIEHNLSTNMWYAVKSKKCGILASSVITLEHFSRFLTSKMLLKSPYLKGTRFLSLKILKDGQSVYLVGICWNVSIRTSLAMAPWQTTEHQGVPSGFRRSDCRLGKEESFSENSPNLSRSSFISLWGQIGHWITRDHSKNW